MKILTTALFVLTSLITHAETSLEIIKLGHPTLRSHARVLNLNEVASPNFQKFIDDMIFTMKKVGGVGLAAPQVNQSVRMFVMKSGLQVPLTVVINPIVEYLEEFGQQDSVEGCLSIPGQTLKVRRYKKIRMSYLNRHGEYVIEEVKGFKAIISQHEYDHLNGILIVDLLQQMFTKIDYESYINAPLM